MPNAARQSLAYHSGEAIMEGLLAWDRLPRVLGRWVASIAIADWDAHGWTGVVEVRGYGGVDTRLALARQDRRAWLQLGSLGRAELAWCPPGAEPAVTGPADFQPATARSPCAAANSRRIQLQQQVWAEDPATLRVLEIALRRLLRVAELRARLLERRIGGAGFPLDRCRRCFGPLLVAGPDGRQGCAWSEHEARAG